MQCYSFLFSTILRPESLDLARTVRVHSAVCAMRTSSSEQERQRESKRERQAPFDFNVSYSSFRGYDVKDVY